MTVLLLGFATLADEALTLRPERVSGIAGGQRAVALRPVGAEWGGRTFGESDRLGSFEFAGHQRHVVLEHEPESDGALPVRLWIDADGDEHLGQQEVCELEWSGTELLLARVPVTLAETTVELIVHRSAETVGLSLRGKEHLRAEFERAGEAWVALFFDGDLDGTLEGERDVWIADRAAFVGALNLANAPTDLPRVDEPWFLTEDDCVRFAGQAADGAVTLRFGTSETSYDEVLTARAPRVHEPYVAWFERDAAAFHREHGIDPDLPRVESPAPWKYVRDELAARRHATREGKPLLVELYSDSCPWCHRLPWVTYPDARVDELLRQFARVRVNSVLDRSGWVSRLGVRGTPRLLVLGEDMRIRGRIDGWMPPAEFAAKLRGILATIQDGR